MFKFNPFLYSLLVVTLSQPTKASSTILPFKNFLGQYLAKSSDTLQAKRQLASAENLKVQRTDQWQSRLVASPELSFEKQIFDGGSRPDNSNRTNNVVGRLTQNMPSGTQIELSGQKYIETQNPLFSALDRSYSAKISQDLMKNSFGRSQRAQSNLGMSEYQVAQLEYRQSLVNSCEKAFNLYADAFIQQEVTNLLQEQLVDAEKASKISRRLYRNKLINRVDHLTSESDFIETKLQVAQAQLKLINTKKQIQAFVDGASSHFFSLADPSGFLTPATASEGATTITQAIVKTKLVGQEYLVVKAKSDRATDVQLGLEVGERFGRLAFNGPLINYNEEYLKANLTIGFDLINNTENAELKNAIFQKNLLVKEQIILEKTQKSRLEGLVAMSSLLQEQVKSSEIQVKLLKEKTTIAFQQMKRAQLDFQNYLGHRNAYLNQQKNYLNLKKELWLNQFSLSKEFAHSNKKLCEVAT